MNQFDSFNIFPKSFNKELFFKIFQLIGRGQSMLLSAPPGMGKTMTLKIIEENKEMSEEFLPGTKIISLNINAEESQDQTGTDLLNKLLVELDEQEDVSPNFSNFLEQNPLLIYEKLRFKLTNQLKSPQTKIVITIDHIEKICSEKFSNFFVLLKSIHEISRSRISFIFIADSNLTKSASFANFAAIQPLLVENVITLNPLSNNDSKTFLEKIEEIMNSTISPANKQKIITVSGGFPRLMKRLAILSIDGVNLDEIVNNPQLDKKLKIDLQRIADYIELNADSNFQIPLLAKLGAGATSSLDKIGEIHFTTTLTKQELALAKLLIENRGILIDREEMIKAVWPNNRYETSEHALDQMIHRLKKKLETATPKCNLQTIRGRGAKLNF